MKSSQQSPIITNTAGGFPEARAPTSVELGEIHLGILKFIHTKSFSKFSGHIFILTDK